MAAHNWKLGDRTEKGTLITQDILDGFVHDAEFHVVVKENNAAQFEVELTRAIATALEEIGLVAEGYAKRLCPVDTGRLRNSITHEIDVARGQVSIGTNVNYAPYVELGTRKYDGANGGRGFLRPAAQDHMQEYRKIAEKHLKKKDL